MPNVSPIESVWAMSKPKSYHESFAKFFEAPTRDGFRELMKANHGELRTCDFKAQWPEHSGVSRHVLGLANSGGGCLVVGVSEADDGTLLSTGLVMLMDKADVTNGLKNYLPSPLLGTVDVVNFAFDASEYATLIGKRFQVLFVEDNPTHLPFVAMRGGANIRQSAIYVRREGVTDEANHDELQTIINRRLATGHSTQGEADLRTHIDQLKMLYSLIAPHNDIGFQMKALHLGVLGLTPNPRYPKEDFESFVARLIERKKLYIEQELGVRRRSG